MWDMLACLFLVPVVIALTVYAIGFVIDWFKRKDEGDPPVRMA